MRLLGIDYGDKRVGIAVSDPMQKLAFGASVIENKGTEHVIKGLKEIMDRYGDVEAIIVGLPVSLRGTESDQTRKVRRFIDEMSKSIYVPVKTIDERLTTVETGRRLQESGMNAKRMRSIIDEASAMNILQRFLDQKMK